MSGRAYLLVVAVCALWLGARAATQPAGFDFDEQAHLLTVAQIREFSGLPPAERFPDIVRPETYESNQATYHTFPPLPYLLMAGATAVAQTNPAPPGVLGISRGISALMALIAIVAVGLAVRNLQTPSSTWSAPAAVTAGFALMPSLHSMGASVTASTWALAAVGLTTAASTWAVRRNWSCGATLAVVGAATFVVAARASAYPVLLLIPLAMLAARLSLRAAVLRLGIIAATVLLVNGWWLTRNLLVTGDLLGTGMYVQVHMDSKYFGSVVRESAVWRQAASSPWPAWTLLTSTDWLWVVLSRMLVRITWTDPLTIVLWFIMVLVPAAAVVIRRTWCDHPLYVPRVLLLAGAGGVVMTTLTFTVAVMLSAQLGWFGHLRETFIVSIPVLAAVAALADLRQDRLRTLFFGSGLAFAAAANAGFMLAVLP